MSILLRLGEPILHASEPEEAAAQLLSSCASPGGLGYRRALILLPEDGADCLECFQLGEGGRVQTIWESEGGLGEISSLLLRGMMADGRVAIHKHREGAPAPVAELLDLLGARSCVCVPLTGPGGPVGLLVLDGDSGGTDPGEPRLACALSLARRAACVIEACLARRRAARLESRMNLLGEVSAKVVSSARLEEILRVICRAAVQGTGSGWGVVWIYDEAIEHLRVAASFGADTATGDDPIGQAAQLAQRAIREGVLVKSPGEESGRGHPPTTALPLVALDQPLGAMAVLRPGPADPGIRREVTGEEGAFLVDLGRRAAHVVQAARLSDQVREAHRRGQELQGMMMQTEKLAALGEVSAKVAHEIRNPLSAIGGFARRIEKSLPEEDPNRKYAGIIARETRRLEALLTEQLLFAQTPSPRMSPVDLNELARETLDLIREETEGAGVELVSYLEGTLPLMLLDGDRIKQVILNILKNALASVHKGGRIRVRTRAVDGWAQIEIANDGERLPGEILDSLFVPFATARSTGCGLGLAVADQIVKEHGGEIRVQSGTEWSVIFTVSLPVRTNKDRRKSTDRRGRRDRRRAA